VVTSPGHGFDRVEQIDGIRLAAIEIPRPITPVRDLRALWRLYRLFKRIRPDIVHSTTPKAGLLCAVAARLARVPVRLHTFTGQVWAVSKGLRRWAPLASDWLVARLCTLCYADSHSQREYLIELGVASSRKLAVIGAGSLGGVDFEKMDRARLAPATGALRMHLGIPAGARVIVFVGRVNRDKGIVELVNAFERLSQKLHDVYLVVVGPLEPELAPLPEEILAILRAEPKIRLVGYDPEAERYLALADVLCLPSYREGFPNVIIEAAALGVPTVGTRITGLMDSVIDADTGILVPVRDSEALAHALHVVLTDESYRQRLGDAARRRARELFDARTLNAALLAEYERLANARVHPT
jgi:glycosyltransferase involved in cell wall biosynthesis